LPKCDVTFLKILSPVFIFELVLNGYKNAVLRNKRREGVLSNSKNDTWGREINNEPKKSHILFERLPN
jgi:hypothetical protein